MKNYLKPQHYFKNITAIPPDFFRGSDLIIFDVDNTLIFPETTQTSQEVIHWFSEITKHYRCVCISNSRTIKQRKDAIEKLLGCAIFIGRHRKPSGKLFNDIIQAYHADAAKTFVVGDRIFTDMLFGNFHGATTILVGRLTEREYVAIKMARIIEQGLLFIINKITKN